MPYPWDDRLLLEKDFQYLEGVYKKILKTLADNLNDYHKVKYPEKYWKTLIGIWLGWFLHALFERQNNLNHLIPFQHEDIDKWRNSLSGGLKYRFKDTNIILQGGLDDVWFNTKTEELIVADYKSQQKNEEVSQETYFNGAYKEGYKRQLDFYAYLLKGMGYKVSSDAYFYICNAKEVDEGFHGKMLFDEVLIHYEVKTDYLEDEIQKIRTKSISIVFHSNKKINGKSGAFP